MTRYPDAWRNGDIQARIRERAGHRCEHCGMAFVEDSNIAVTARNRNGKPVIGTVHHINGNKSDCSYQNLVYVCQRCHLHIQAIWAPGDPLPSQWDTPPAWLIKRGLPFVDRRPRQLTLPGIEAVHRAAR